MLNALTFEIRRSIKRMSKNVSVLQIILDFYLITEGVISYQTQQGFYKTNLELDFRDGSYDGTEDENGNLRSGLGLLTDMIYGSIDFTRNHKGIVYLTFYIVIVFSCIFNFISLQFIIDKIGINKYFACK